MNDKMYKKFLAVCVILFICVVINFIITLGSGSANVDDLHNKINSLEREVATLANNGNNAAAMDMMEERLALLEKGGDATMEKRVFQLEMKIAALEKTLADALSKAKPAAQQPAAQQTPRPAAPQQPAGITTGQPPQQQPAAAKPAQQPAQSQGIKYHVVQAGETVYRISTMYNITVDQLKSMNNLPDNTIHVGQRLIVGR